MKTLLLTGVFIGQVIFLPVHAAVAVDAMAMNVNEYEFAADFYDNGGEQPSIGVLVLGGSEGGKPTRQATGFAKAGYPVLSLAYFKAPQTPDYLDMIPLEYFDKPIEWLAKTERVQGRGIVVVGSSKGAELALLLASRHSQITGVIATSPSSVVFQGIPQVFWPPRSSWSYEGKGIPFVPYDASQGVDPTHLLPLYRLSLAQTEAVAKATIEVEKINGPILLLTGSDDAMWPASEMAEAITERLKANAFPHSYRHINYQDAGHTLNEFFMLGGTKEGNQKARLDSERQIADFLSKQNTP